jgi:hypothetical protein
MLAQILLIALLATLHIVFTWAPPGTHNELLVRAVDVDRESNLPTWFASTQWLLLALTLAAIALVSRFCGEGRRRTVLWAVLAVSAAYFSLDEVAILHERLGTAFEEMLQASATGSPLRSILGFRSYYWILVYAPIALPAALALGVFVWRELGASRRLALLGIFVFLYAAVGLDCVEGRYGDSHHDKLPILVGSHSFAFDIFLLEETLEMLGLAFVLVAFLRHLSNQVARWRAIS